MHADARPLPKEERQRLIESVIGRRRVGTQLELREALAAAGCAVTQATLSRDLRELGIEKVHDELGRARYAIPGGRRSDPAAALASVLEQFGRRVTAAREPRRDPLGDRRRPRDRARARPASSTRWSSARSRATTPAS